MPRKKRISSVVRSSSSGASVGSALLLTVMVISVITTTTLGAIAVRFDQFFATSRINDSNVAKLAADSGLAKLKEKLTVDGASALAQPYSYDLTTGVESNPNNTDNYSPNPRDGSFTLEKAGTNLPRCIAVASLIPWTNDGQYINQLASSSSANPVMIFYYANIINDSPLGVAPGNSALTSAQKATPISQLSKMGHFYNPYAPAGTTPSQPSYWTIKLGGPDDQFLTRKGSDGAHSYYQGLDFVYVPYLPRFTDTGLFNNSSGGSGLIRVTAADLQTKFQDTIVYNNFRVWLDASVTDDVLYKYGYGDLFGDSSPYRVRWLQPTLWNDIPEESQVGPYMASDDGSSNSLSWSKKSQPLLTNSSSNGWNVNILKGSKPFSYIKFAPNTSFGPNAIVSGQVYGGLDGIRIGQKVAIKFLQAPDPITGARNPVVLSRLGGTDSHYYNVVVQGLTINSTATGGSVTIRLQIPGTSPNISPLASSGSYMTSQDFDMAFIDPITFQFSTSQSLQNVALSTDGNGVASVSFSGNANATCSATASFAGCPAVSDIVELTKAGSTPVWGVVSSVGFASGGSPMVSFKLDAAHLYPKPMSQMAATSYTNPAGQPVVAIYGGWVDMNDYDAGFDSESDELWLYYPEQDQWTFVQPAGTTPGRLAGASLIYDSTNQQLLLTGGYRHVAVDLSGAGCTTNNQNTCLQNDYSGSRIAKRINGDMYAIPINASIPQWAKVTPSSPGVIQNGQPYQARVLSTFADRSGSTGNLRLIYSTASGSTTTVNLNGSVSTATIPISVAGIAVGDEVALSGDGGFTAWGRVDSLTTGAKQINFRTYGYQSAGSSVSVANLRIRVVNRVIGESSCTGSVMTDASNNTYYGCTFNAPVNGYAVGDLIELEQYQFANNATQIQNSLYGYLTGFEGTTAYFDQDETDPTIADFNPGSNPADTSKWKLAGHSAVALPSPRFGGTWQLDPRSATTAYLWNGADRNSLVSAKYMDYWKLSMNGGNSYSWSFVPMTNNAPTSTSSYYYYQFLRYPQLQPNYTIFSSSSSLNGAIVPGGSGWDNTASWTVYLNNSASTDEADAIGKITQGESVVLQRCAPSGSTTACSTFHGRVAQATFDATHLSNSSTPSIVLTHDASYGSEQGLSGSSANVEMELTTSFNTSTYYGNSDGSSTMSITANSDGTISIKVKDGVGDTAAQLAAVPPVGSTITLYRQPVGSFSVESYTATIRQRSYSFSPGLHSFILYPDLSIGLGTGKVAGMLNSPLPIAFGTNYLAADSVNTTGVFSADYQLYQAGNAPGAAEWYAQVTNNPSWQTRMPHSGTTNNGALEYGTPRVAGAFASTYDGSNSTAYVFGGTKGAFPTIWRETKAGLNPSSTGIYGSSDASQWWLTKSADQQSTDLPNLFATAFAVYRSGSVVKLVALGGKSKANTITSDYNRYGMGPKVLTGADAANLVDNSYYLQPSSNSPSSVPFVNAVYNDFNDPLTSAKDSFKLNSYLADSTHHACPYVADVSCNGFGGQDLRNLGTMGRITSDASNAAYSGSSYGFSSAAINPGNAFLNQSVNSTTVPSLIISGPGRPTGRTDNRPDQDGYYPYLCDATNSGSCPNYQPSYGTHTTNYNSTKTLMLAGYAAITQDTQSQTTIPGVYGGSILFTGVGIGTALLPRSGVNAPNHGFSYCPASSVSNNYTSCAASAGLSWLPDPEDIVFMFNAAKVLSSSNTFKVVGYYAGIRRGYLATLPTGSVSGMVVQEIVP